MHDLLAVIVAGLVSGSAYALLALGIVIIFRSTDTVNFAIGDMATLGVFCAVTVVSLGAPAWLAVFIAIAVAGGSGIATERFLIRPLGSGHRSLFIALVVTIGIGLLIHAAIGGIWGHRPIRLAPIVPGSFTIFGVALSISKLIATAIALVAMALVAWFFNYTIIGVAMRASAEDHFGARVVGINPGRIAALAWFIGCGLAAVAAYFLAMDASLNANLTLSPLFRAFAGVFFGGLSSMPGAAAGGFAIGILDNLAGRYLSANYRDTIVFAFIIAVLFLKPSGFLGTGRKERV